MITPIENHNGYFFKRDDYFTFGNANGGKVRIMIQLAKGAKGLVACGDRVSTQISRTAAIAFKLGLPCRIHTASGEFTAGMNTAKLFGAKIIQHSPGYLSVVKKRATDDAIATGLTEIPWGLECQQAIEVTCAQVCTFPKGVKRLVVPVGSGMTLAGLLYGLEGQRILIPVIGIILGGEVEKRLDKFAPVFWRNSVKLVKAQQDFHSEAPEADQNFQGVPLDPIYEAKCVPFLRKGDCLWIVGRR